MPFRNNDQSRETTIRRQQEMIKQLTSKLNEIELRNKNYHEKRFERPNGQPQHHRTFHGQEKGRYYGNRGTQNMEYMPFYTVENHYPKNFHIRIKSPIRQGYQNVNKQWYNHYDANQTTSSGYRQPNSALLIAINIIEAAKTKSITEATIVLRAGISSKMIRTKKILQMKMTSVEEI